MYYISTQSTKDWILQLCINKKHGSFQEFYEVEQLNEQSGRCLSQFFTTLHLILNIVYICTYIENQFKLCSSRRLEDPVEEVRAQAVISLGTLNVKNERIIRSLVEMLELDSSEYVRLIVSMKNIIEIYKQELIKK